MKSPSKLWNVLVSEDVCSSDGFSGKVGAFVYPTNADMCSRSYKVLFIYYAENICSSDSFLQGCCNHASPSLFRFLSSLIQPSIPSSLFAVLLGANWRAEMLLIQWALVASTPCLLPSSQLSGKWPSVQMIPSLPSPQCSFSVISLFQMIWWGPYTDCGRVSCPHRKQNCHLVLKKRDIKPSEIICSPTIEESLLLMQFIPKPF